MKILPIVAGALVFAACSGSQTRPDGVPLGSQPDAGVAAPVVKEPTPAPPASAASRAPEPQKPSEPPLMPDQPFRNGRPEPVQRAAKFDAPVPIERKLKNGARVLMLEIAPEEARAGNSAFTGGAFRVVYHGADDLARLIPDMNETELRDVDFGTYTEELRALAHQVDPDLREGVYVAVAGPNFETPAELRMLRGFGADAVGMSTVPEVLAARHLGMRILAIATVTDMATGIPGQIEHVTGEQVLEVAARAGERLGRLVTGVVAKL